jgi:hypothetical protein
VRRQEDHVSGEPSLTEKVLELLAVVPDDRPEIEALSERVILRIETAGRAEYVLADGAERHEQATAAEEARNFCEEIEDALAYAANAYYIGGDPRWRAVPPALAVLWQLARHVQSGENLHPPSNVIAFRCRVDETGGAA